MPTAVPGFRIRNGKPADLAELCEIESRSFAADRLSRRSFRRHMAGTSSQLRVATAGGAIAGYHLVFIRSGTAVARLYSIAVAAAARGQGLGEKLLADAARQARRSGAAVLRLEVRPDNAGAIRLYEQHGFARIGTYRQYYADGSDALRYQKQLRRAGGRAAGAQGSGGDADEDRSPRDSGKFRRVMKLSRSAAPPLSGFHWRACRAAGLFIRGAANG
jgi:[ribosomal protein S18]-alanine N-acetyltransferase